MFESRKDLIKFLAVADTGKILVAADQLAITQPALSRCIARFEAQCKGRLFERVSRGVRLTPLGILVADLSRRILREIEYAENRVNWTVSGRTGRLNVTAGPMWMQAVLPTAIQRFRQSYPGIELALRTTANSEGLRLLISGESDMHCGGIDTQKALPSFLRREWVLQMTARIVAHRDHPLQGKPVSCEDLIEYPWIEFDATSSPGLGNEQPSLTNVLNELYAQTNKRVQPIIRTSSVGLFLLGTGPYLSYLPSTFLDRLPGGILKPLPSEFGLYHYRAGVVTRRSVEALPPFAHFRKLVVNTALDIMF